MPPAHLLARILSILALGLVSTLACAPGEGRSYERRRTSPSMSVEGAQAFDVLDQAYVVPPDRALVRVSLVGNGETYDASRARLQQHRAAVEAAARSGGCRVTLAEYVPPTVGGWRGFQARADLRVEVDLREAADVDARVLVIDECLAPLSTLSSASADDEVAPGLSDVHYSVADPQAHAGALWARHAASLQPVSAAAGAPQQHPEDLRCVSSGRVSVTDAGIAGVALALDVTCRAGEDAAPGGVAMR